jgi:hypothetical protein
MKNADNYDEKCRIFKEAVGVVKDFVAALFISEGYGKDNAIMYDLGVVEMLINNEIRTNLSELMLSECNQKMIGLSREKDVLIGKLEILSRDNKGLRNELKAISKKYEVLKKRSFAISKENEALLSGRQNAFRTLEHDIPFAQVVVEGLHNDRRGEERSRAGSIEDLLSSFLTSTAENRNHVRERDVTKGPDQTQMGRSYSRRH